MKIIYACIVSVVLFLGSCSKAVDSVSKGKPGSITRFATNGAYMYVLDQNNITTYSIANADEPKLITRLITDYGLETITIYEGVGYVGSRTALYILDLTNPADPKVLSQSERDGTLRGGCDPVVVKGNYAYSTVKVIENVCGSVNAFSQLLAYDVTDKQNPVLLKSTDMVEPNGLGYSGNTLFVCEAGTNEIVLFDISNPGAPAQYSAIQLNNPIDVIVSNSRLIASAKTGFSFYDISDLDNIRLVGSIVKQ